ncbi:MAG TPA: T9SS type A sorting domain-containing protein, partial [Bacteroidia bacterium]|nr:T9SS type A sorting domain-containing protein [Bacteroidia bacterium]
FTYSVDFPIMGNTFQSIHASQSDVFVAKFDPAGQMEWSTFLGGTGVENGLALDRKGKYIFISGNTESPNFPVTANAIQNTYAATSDGFVVKMDTAGTMVSGTFMGGNGVDALYAVGVTNDTSIISCGTTYSTNLAVTPGAYQSTNMTQGDGYVVKFGMSEQNVGNAENDSNQSRSDLVLYPVPTNGILHIGPEQKNIVFIDVYDMSGKVVKTIQGNFSSGTIDVSELAPGNYSLAMHYTGGMILGFPFIKN